MTRRDMPSASEIAHALGGKSIGRGQWMAKCPSHIENTGSLSIKDGHSGPLVYCFGGCTQDAVIAALQERGVWPQHNREHDDEEARRRRQERDRKAAADRRDDEAHERARAASDLLRAKDALRESFAPTPTTIVGIYLIARGIDPPWPACIREHRRLYHRNGAGVVTWHPAMVCPIRDVHSNEVIGCHRTYLAPGGAKAEVDCPKKVLGRIVGGAVKLTPDEEVTLGLGVSEGIENGLTALAENWSPVWALGTAGNLASFPLLNGVEALTIFADNDDDRTGTGEKAAQQCATRWRAAGREVTVYIPKAAGCDWNDELGHR
jgi:hypothetical protein